MLTPDLLSLVPGAAGAINDRDYLAHHRCHYTSESREPVTLIFGEADGDDDPLEGEALIKVAGRPTFPYEDVSGRASSCRLTTYPTAARTAGGHTETLELLVIVADKRSSLCTETTKLADRPWRKLPA